MDLNTSDGVLLEFDEDNSFPTMLLSSYLPLKIGSQAIPYCPLKGLGCFIDEKCPLDAALFLIFTQLSWDGYLLLFSPKSSFHGTVT
jgi:hypothetical protein